MSALHHVSIIAGNARQNYQFYTDVLGMRLVKCTVNFEDPTAYHLYFGDEAGTPGSLITFFPWENVAPGRLGVGEVQETVLQVPDESLGFWMHRFLQKGVVHDSIERRFGRSTLPFRDPHGTRLAMVSTPDIQNEPAFSGGKVPFEHAVRGLHSVSLLVEQEAPTAQILTEVFGYQPVAREGSISRYALPGNKAAGIIDIRAVGGFLKPRPGGGSVHHIAFRARDEAEQAALTAKIEQKFGLQPTEVKDRKYFKSVYFREPGHILFEIATDKPGMSVDEPEATLGSGLMLPETFEPMRDSIEANLPKFR